MTEDNRLAGLMQALAAIMQRSLPDADVTFGELEMDSHRLVELMIACDGIYGMEIPFEMLDISTETTINSLHGQILHLLGNGAPGGDAQT